MLTDKTIKLTSYVVILVIGVVSYWLNLQIARDTRDELGSSLTTVLETTRQAVHSWHKEHRHAAETLANSVLVRDATRQLLELERSSVSLLSAEVQSNLRKSLQPLQLTRGYHGYLIIAPDSTNIASSRDHNVGMKNLLADQPAFLKRVLGGESAMSLPVPSEVSLPDKDGRQRIHLPTMFVGAPIYDDAGKVMAIFTFRINPAEGFTTLLRKGRIGGSGETYAFDRQGRLISDSRFDEQLRDIGLITRIDRAILNITLRDPGVNLIEGKQPVQPLDERPLTRMAASAIKGEAGVDLDGYRDYRGVPVVGAWFWDKQLGFGMATEFNKSEAYHTLNITRAVIISFTVFSMLLLVGMVKTWCAHRERKDALAELKDVREQLEEQVNERTQSLVRSNEELVAEMLDRQKAEDALRESEQRYRTLVELSPDTIVVHDREGMILFANSAAAQMAGARSPNQLEGRSIYEFIHPDYRDDAIALREKMIADQQPLGPVEQKVISLDGSEIDVGATAGHLIWNNVPAIQIIIRDIRRRKQAERQTLSLLSKNRELTQRLFQLQEDERQTIARELHDEFGQWLTAIQLDAQNIANRLGTQSPEVMASIESITNSAKQIHQGIRQMVHSLQPALLDELGLQDSLCEMVTQWQALNPDISCDLQLEGQLDDLHQPLAITLYRLVQEGLTNVSKHANADQVRVHLQRTSDEQSQVDRLLLSIEDNGIGMSPSVANEGLGLLGMRERVLSLGGEFEITDAKKTYQCKGVCIHAHFDLESRTTS